MLTSSTPFVLFIDCLLLATFLSCVLSGLAHVTVNRAVTQDDRGDAVRVPATLDRLLSLDCSMTQALCAVRFGKHLVEMTPICDDPAGTAQSRNVWNAVRPNLGQFRACDLRFLLRVSVSFRCALNSPTRPGFLFC